MKKRKYATLTNRLYDKGEGDTITHQRHEGAIENFVENILEGVEEFVEPPTEDQP